MENNNLQLVKTALKVLPENAGADFENWYRSEDKHQPTGRKTTATTAQCAIINYNLDQPSNLTLPHSLGGIQSAVDNYLESSERAGPWGVLTNDIIGLKLSDQANSRSGRLLLFKFSFISAVIKRLFPDENITRGEQRTTLQCLSGLTLKEAAEADHVSYETKKSQLNSVFQKTKIRRQQELSNFLVAHLTLEVASTYSRQDNDSHNDQNFFSYVDNYLWGYARASVIQESKNKRFRMVEFGDPSGRPVVCVHHLGIFSFSPTEIDCLKKNRIRLMCPLRHGAISPKDDDISLDEHVEHALEGIDLAVSLLGGKAVAVMSMLSGCYYSMHYAKRFPDKVSTIIMLGATYKEPTLSGSLSTFKNDLHRVATVDPAALKATVSYLVTQVDTAGALEKVWKESLNECEVDFDEVDALLNDDTQRQAMQDRVRYSPLSITHDLDIQANTDWHSLFSQIKGTEAHYIHGSEDAVIPIELVHDFIADKPNHKLHVIDGAGNWIFNRYFDQVCSKLNKILKP